MASIFKQYMPFTNARTPRAGQSSGKAEILISDPSVGKKLVKIVSLALGMQGSGSGSRASFEASKYDFAKIIQAIDTDSFVKQGFNKYRELFWKEGWEIVSDNPDAVDYLHARIDLIELVMRRPFQDLLYEVGDQLVKFSNCFLAKSRGPVQGFLPGYSIAPMSGMKDPISGYYVVPVETVEIQRDPNNRPVKYRQNVQGGGGSGSKAPEWDAGEMIHFFFDRKPGRAFGTPFIIAGIDDVVSLRQIEEDTLNLVHRELFPLYTYKVGTPEHPAEKEEIEQAANELANMRVDGGLVHPERHEVSVLGAENKALDATEYLKHWRQRVIVMLGLAEHHLGLTSAGGNKAVTDRLDIALYDKIKMYQSYVSDMIRLFIFNELLFEGGFDPLTVPEDRCFFRFKEIDVDTQVKKENHTIQKYANNIIGQSEVRLKLGEDPMSDESDLLAALQARLTPNATTTVKTADGGSEPVQVDTTPPTAQKNTDKATPSKGGQANLPNARKGVGNKSRPQNQFGRRMSPNIRHMSDDLIETIVDLLGDDVSYNE